MNITDLLTNCVNKRIPISFSKYGDGEYNCATNEPGANCDNDSYSILLSDALRRSFKQLTNETNNSYMGMWIDMTKTAYWESLSSKHVNWAKYETIIIDDKHIENKDLFIEQKVKLFKAIKSSTIKKIIICNPLLERAKALLNIDDVIYIPLNNWFDKHYYDVVNIASSLLNPNECHIVITCCGMSAKPLICDLKTKYPNGIYLDFGHALDHICTKKNTRGSKYTYDEIKEIFKDLLPETWEDEKYEKLFQSANNSLGLHL